MAGHHDPRLLYAIDNITACHIQHGEESSLTPSGPQTLSLLMVPTSSPFADLSTTTPQNEIPEEDFYLHLHLPPELDLPLPATTQIYHQPPRSYLIPRWDLGPDSGAFTRIDFPEKFHQDDVDTFETILAQCTAFLERAPPPTGGSEYKPYNPADWGPGGSMHEKGEPGHIVLIDEDDGSVVGELTGGKVVEDSNLTYGTKDPVEIEVGQDGNINIRPASEDYLHMTKHPAYRDSSLVQNAATASRLIVTGSSHISNMLTSSAQSFTQRTKPAPKPMTFSPATHERARKLHNMTASGANMSSKTLGQVGKYAQNFGATLSKRSSKGKEKSKNGGEGAEYKPGVLNKSMMAFSTIADGIAESGRRVLAHGSAAASTVVEHRYGSDAGAIAGQLAGGVKNVGLVYIDVTGVSRRAVVKSVAKGMVVGKVSGAGDVIVGSGDGGAISDQDLQAMAGAKGAQNKKMAEEYPSSEVGFGSAGGPPPRYESELGEPMGSAGRVEKNTYI